MDESRLLPVRCPGMVMDKAKGELVKCNKLALGAPTTSIKNAMTYELNTP